MKINEENNKNKGFVITGTLIAWAIGMIVVLGTGSYLANKALNKQADSGFNNINRTIKDKDFISKYSGLNNSHSEELSKVEIDGLISMREEEKLARDVYRTLYEKWGLNIFKNISYSENRHTLVIKTLLDKYGIKDPVKDDTTGVFISNKIQKLYSVFLEQGSVSLVDALEVGITIEDLDIYDLKKLVENTNANNIRMIYESLERGSRNHMRLFMTQLKLNNGKYDAQYLPQGEIDGILKGDHEIGIYAGMSRQQGHKKGKGLRDGIGHVRGTMNSEMKDQ